MKNLFLVRGVPGCGKSTLVDHLKVQVDVCADDYHTDDQGNYNWKPKNSKAGHAWCQEEVRKAMQSDYINSIAVHNTFTQQWEMQPYYDMAAEYGYRVTSLIVENRHGSKSVHNVPVETIKAMTDRFEIKLAPDVVYEDYVQIKEQNGLFVHKYKRKVFYDNLWDIHPELKDARGLVKDADGNIVQYPFTKIFNYKENGTVIDPNNEVIAVDKINGFMAAVTWYNDDILVSTTGSLTSDFVDMAKEILPLEQIKPVLQKYPEYSFVFEIVHPNDPHIIPEEIGAYLLGGREKKLGSYKLSEWLLDDIAAKMSVKRPDWKYVYFEDLLEEVKTYQREGFVVYDQESDVVLKIKTPFYLTAKFIARTKQLDKIFSKNYKQTFDEEFYGLIEHLQENYSSSYFMSLPEQTRLEIVRKWAEVAYV